MVPVNSNDYPANSLDNLTLKIPKEIPYSTIKPYKTTNKNRSTLKIKPEKRYLGSNCLCREIKSLQAAIRIVKQTIWNLHTTALEPSEPIQKTKKSNSQTIQLTNLTSRIKTLIFATERLVPTDLPRFHGVLKLLEPLIRGIANGGIGMMVERLQSLQQRCARSPALLLRLHGSQRHRKITKKILKNKFSSVPGSTPNLRRPCEWSCKRPRWQINHSLLLILVAPKRS